MAMDKIKNILFILIVSLMCHMLDACSDYAIKLGDGYTFVHEGDNFNYIFHEFPAKGGEIPPNVISFDYDKRFIIVKQKPMPFQYGYETAEEYANRTDTFAPCYWLIIKKEHKTLGPMDYDSFQRLRKQYKVPDKLVLYNAPQKLDQRLK